MYSLLFNVGLVFYNNRKKRFLVIIIYVCKLSGIPYSAMYKSLNNYLWNSISPELLYIDINS